jgi:hypothetical protein|eukprot:SAG25_NODE_591_length_6692_cov_3.648718_3_plen_130_part_00
MSTAAVSECIASAALRQQLVQATPLNVKAQRIMGVVAARLRSRGADEDADLLLALRAGVLAAQQKDAAAAVGSTSAGSVAITAAAAAGAPSLGWPSIVSPAAERVDRCTVGASQARAFYRRQLASNGSS